MRICTYTIYTSISTLWCIWEVLTVVEQAKISTLIIQIIRKTHAEMVRGNWAFSHVKWQAIRIKFFSKNVLLKVGLKLEYKY